MILRGQPPLARATAFAGTAAVRAAGNHRVRVRSKVEPPLDPQLGGRVRFGQDCAPDVGEVSAFGRFAAAQAASWASRCGSPGPGTWSHVGARSCPRPGAAAADRAHASTSIRFWVLSVWVFSVCASACRTHDSWCCPRSRRRPRSDQLPTSSPSPPAATCAGFASPAGSAGSAASAFCPCCSVVRTIRVDRAASYPTCLLPGLLAARPAHPRHARGSTSRWPQAGGASARPRPRRVSWASTVSGLQAIHPAPNQTIKTRPRNSNGTRYPPVASCRAPNTIGPVAAIA